MDKKIILEEIYKTEDEMNRKKIIRQNLINMIKRIQDGEVLLRDEAKPLQSLKSAIE